MTYDLAPKLARVLTGYCRPVQPGDVVCLKGLTAAAPLFEALYEEVVRRGGHPVLRVDLPNTSEIFLRHASEAQLDWIDPSDMLLLDEMDVLFTVLANTNTKALADLPPERLVRAQQGQRPMIEKYLARCADDDLRWNISAWPTQADAQEAEMGYVAYRAFVYNACGLNHDDPVAYWTAFRARQDRLIAWLDGKETLEVHGPGVELTMNIAGRAWINCYGARNFPDGEIYTCPHEDSVNGQISFNLPTIYSGREINGVTLVFKDGAVVEASAEKGEDFLLSQLDMDDGARRLGEWAIGTNAGIDRFTRSTLFDEKMGGTIHMALGENPGPTGGVNTSAIHWDMIHRMTDGAEVLVDGETFYKDGAFVVT